MDIPPTWFVLLSSSMMGLFTRHQAKKSGRNANIWFWIGFFFGGLGIFAFYMSKHSFMKKQQPPQPPLFPKLCLDLGAWYYIDNEKTLGPYSRDYIQKLFEEETITLSTLVWHESMSEWGKLEKFKKI